MSAENLKRFDWFLNISVLRRETEHARQPIRSGVISNPCSFVGKMLIMGSVFHMIDPVLTIAAAMSVQSPFTRRFTNDPDVMNARQLLESEHGDPFTLLNAFDEWLHVKGKGSASRKWCRRRGLEEQRFYEMIKLKEQFEELLFDHGLVERKSSSSRERKQENHHKLRKLKREHSKGPRRPKMLKLGQQGAESDEEGSEVDLRDIEFKLTHDLDKLQRGSTLRRSFTLRDLNLLKIILCCGLYPQLTIPDEHNASKNVSEHVFHTHTKQFLMLHPTCVFVSQPELMYPKQEHVPSTSRRGAEGCRRDHEMMSYVSLLETRKAYIMNVMRVPALQTLLLFGSTVDSNADCTRLVVDDWIELGIPDAALAQQTVSSVIHLRTTWDMLLKRRIERNHEEDENIESLGRVLSSKLSEFLDSAVSYTIKRLLQSDIDHLYMGNDGRDFAASLNVPVLGNMKGVKVHPTKGGIMVNHFFTYNDLLSQTEAEAASNAAQYIQKHWTCGMCAIKMVVTVLERIEHEKQCGVLNTSESAEIRKPVEEEDGGGESSLARLRKTFVCPDCDEEFSFTATEILRHKRSHR